MKKLIPTKYIPLLTLGCGVVLALLRWLLYATGVDDRGLLEDGNFLRILCRILPMAAAAVLCLAVFPLDGSNRYGDNFSASLPGAVGAFLAAGGILAAVLTDGMPQPDLLAIIRTVAGILAALCLIAIGVCRLKGRMPYFAFPGMVCIFFALNLAHHYRLWSGNPQTQDYIFRLFACIVLMLFAYYHTAFTVDLGHRRALLLCGLLGTILCCLALFPWDRPWLYLGCGAWCVLDLCRLNPPRRRRRRKPEAPAQTPDREVE